MFVAVLRMLKFINLFTYESVDNAIPPDQP